jgi:hypothetical protein
VAQVDVAPPACGETQQAAAATCAAIRLQYSAGLFAILALKRNRFALQPQWLAPL